MCLQILLSCTIPTSCKKSNTWNMMRIHGQIYPQGGWSCVSRSKNLVIHAYAVQSLKPYHQCDHFPRSQHLLKFYWAASQRFWFGATWNLKQKAQWNTFKKSCSQVLSLNLLITKSKAAINSWWLCCNTHET
jgi:hypothetical protein